MALDGRVSGDITDDLGNFLGDPAGWLTGTNKSGFGGVKKMLFGDPDAIKAAYDEAIKASKAQGEQIRDFLLGREAKAQSYFNPLSSMLDKTYGTRGVQAPMIPGSTDGVNPLPALFGGK